jgi:hypothetical protein
MQAALQERGAAEERYQAQLAGLAGELEQTRQGVLTSLLRQHFYSAGIPTALCACLVEQLRCLRFMPTTAHPTPRTLRPSLALCRQELAMRTEAMGAELAAWSGSAEASAAAAEQARLELQERAQDIDSAGAKMRQLAQLLAGAAANGSPLHVAPTQRGAAGALLFHRAGAAAPALEAATSGGSSPKRSPARSGQLPKLKTRAVPGAQLWQPGDSPAGSPGGKLIPALPALGGSPSSRGLQRERSIGSGGQAGWNSAKAGADRYSESQRDAARVSHMARWSKA